MIIIAIGNIWFISIGIQIRQTGVYNPGSDDQHKMDRNKNNWRFLKLRENTLFVSLPKTKLKISIPLGLLMHTSPIKRQILRKYKTINS